MKAFRGLRSFRADAPFRPWLLSIVARETMNMHRAGKRRADLQLRIASRDPVLAQPPDPEGDAIADERRQALLAAVRALPEKDQLVVTCRYFLELSEAETADALGWPKGTVKSRLSRALDRLRSALAVRPGAEVRGG